MTIIKRMTRCLLPILLVLLAMLAPDLIAAQADTTALTPPVATKKPYLVKSAHGDRVDEYYWLRDDNAKAKRPEVMRYLEAENRYAQAMLAPLQPLRDKLFAEMRARVKEDDSSLPVYDRGYWYWERYDAGAEYPVLLRQRGTPEKPDPEAAAEVLLDQPKMAARHAYFSVGATAISPSGRWLAWSEDTTGRQIYRLRFKNLSTGKVLAETIQGVTGGLVWADEQSLFYISQNKITLQGDRVMRHRLGRKLDTLVWHEKDNTLFVGISATASRRYIAIGIGGFNTTELLTVPTARPESAPSLQFKRREGVLSYADHIDDHWVMRTNDRAPNFRLVQAPDGKLDDVGAWQDIVAAADDRSVEDFKLLKGAVAVQERIEAQVRVRVLSAGPERVLADPSATVKLGDNRDVSAAHLRYTLDSMIQPAATWDLPVAGGEPLLRKERPVPGYDKSLYSTRRLWAPARDGQRIPVTLAWRKDRSRPDATAPLYITGYGAYGASVDPDFYNSRVSLMDRGFVVAIAHVRGGSDLGQGWYEAGRLMNKKNSFNDFVDVTDALLKEGWGAKNKVFASGGSAGGLLMGAVANQAGDRYKGIALDVPFVDLVTTMLDESIPLTVNEWTQWGDPRQKPAYDYMLSYSPYDNIVAKAYPAMLVTTGLWDSQVQYFEPAKYVARLRARKTDKHPLLFVVNTTAGHGGASGRFEQLKEVAREYAFFLDLAGQRD